VNFDEPMTRDPLFWAGIVVGAVWGVVTILRQDLTGFDAVLTALASVVGSTWVLAGILATLVRELYRHWRDRRADIELLLKEDAVLKETE
jgi:hypothetical protein